MKKFTVLLAVMLMASFSFAQITTTKKVVKTDGTPLVIKGKSAKANHQKNTNSYWFNLIEDASAFFGVNPDGFTPPIQCDTNGLYPFTDGNSPVQFCSVGQVYDWSHSCWDEMYNYSGAPENVPYMPTENATYSVDSIQMIFLYERGTNVAADVVDTVAISYIIGFDPEEDVRVLSTQADGPVFIMPALPFNNTTFMASTTCMTTSGITNTLDQSTIIYDKIPLTAEDETIDPEDGEATFFYLTLPTPEGLSNLTQKQMAVTVTFIPGSERNPNSLIGTDLSTFRTALYGDPREGYDGTLGTPQVLEDYQLGLFHDADNFIAGSYFYNIYQPNMFWGGNPKPWISLLVSCNDCETVDVPELDKKTLTVYPNPATNHFTVNTGNDEKASIQLFNIVGQQVYSETFTGSTTVSVANLHSGVYMLKVNQNGKVNTTKVVVK